MLGIVTVSGCLYDWGCFFGSFKNELHQICTSVCRSVCLACIAGHRPVAGEELNCGRSLCVLYVVYCSNYGTVLTMIPTFMPVTSFFGIRNSDMCALEFHKRGD